MSSPEPTKVDVQERGANAQTSDRRLYVQLQAFGGCLDPKPLVRALESSRIEAALYQDVNDPRGIGVLAMSENPAFFVQSLCELLNADPLLMLKCVVDPKKTRLLLSFGSMTVVMPPCNTPSS